MRYISIDSAQPGMIVGKSIYNEQGSILVNYRGQIDRTVNFKNA